MTHEPKKSDLAEVAMKPTNKAGLKTAAEPVERRAGTEGNVDQQSTHRTQIRDRVSQALGRVRQAAKERKKERFTALLHHVDIDLLRLSFYALKRQAAVGWAAPDMRPGGLLHANLGDCSPDPLRSLGYCI
jgi:RNA-directed DNA polymerase